MRALVDDKTGDANANAINYRFQMMQAEFVGDVASLHIYPIKGCKAVNVRSLCTTKTGFPFDRHWVIVDTSGSRFITQRVEPRLALITPEIPSEALDGAALTEDMHLTIRLPRTATVEDQIRVPLLKKDQPVKMITVCDWNGYALDEGDEVAEGLSAFLSRDVRLFRFVSEERAAEQDPRMSVPRMVDSTFAYGYKTTFTDGFPYLIINETSYENLQKRVVAQFTIDRFRPNIVVRGLNPWEEDSWRHIAITARDRDAPRGPSFRLVKPCKRCVVTSIDQTTALPSLQPLEALKRMRNGKKTRFATHLKGTEKQGFFGWNAVCSDQKSIAVGDHVKLEKQGVWTPGLSWMEYTQCTWDWLLQKF